MSDPVMRDFDFDLLSPKFPGVEGEGFQRSTGFGGGVGVDRVHGMDNEFGRWVGALETCEEYVWEARRTGVSLAKRAESTPLACKRLLVLAHFWL